jgi:gliding motility-associated-like protein
MSKSAYSVHMKIHFYLFLLTGLLFGFTGFATRFYVGSPGSDVEGGGGAFNPFETVSFAISQAANGDTIVVQVGFYSETNIEITKQVRIFGNETAGVPGVGPKPVFNGSAATANSSIFLVRARNITIRNFELRVDQANVTRGIFGRRPDRFSGLVISDNTIFSTSTGSESTFNTWGIALGLDAANSALSDSSLIVRNVIGPAPNAQLFGRAIRISGGFSTIGGENSQDGNTLTGTYGIQCGDPSGTMRILQNTISATAAGVELNNPVFSADHRIENNTISPVPNFPGGVAMVEIKNNNRVGSRIMVRGNNFSNFPLVGLFSTKSVNVFVENNSFTPADTARGFFCIAVNTKQQTTSQSELPSASSISITGNTFNAASGFGGTAIAFQNHFSGINPPFQNVVVGGDGNAANTFGLLIQKFCELDARSGPSNLVPIWNQTGYKITPMLPVEVNFDLSKNLFDLGSLPKLPSAMSTAELMALEDRIQHQIDFDSLGFVTVLPQRAFVTAASALAPKTTSPSLVRGIGAIDSDGWIITSAPLSFAENIRIASSIALNTEPNGLITISSLEMDGAGKELSLQSDLSISGSLTLNDGKIKTGNSTLTIDASAALSGGSDNSYVQTDGTGSLLRKSVGSVATVYPIGTATSYSPTTLLNSGAADDISLRVQSDVLDGGLTGSPVDSVVGITWIANEALAGGSNLSVTAQWPGLAEKNGFNRTSTLFQGFAGGNWVTLSGADPVPASGGDPFTATYTDISGDLVNLALRVSSTSDNPPTTDETLFFVSESIGDDSRTPAEASNPATPWRTIGKALSNVTDGDSIQVLAGTYNESNLVVNKPVKLFGNIFGIGTGNGQSRPIINGTVGGPDSAVMLISSPNVWIENFQIEVNQQGVKHGLYATSGNYNNLRVKDCRIYSTSVGGVPCVNFNTYGIRLLAGGTDSLIITGTNIEPRDFAVNCAFGRAIRMFSGGRLIAGGPAPSDVNRIIGLYGVQLGDLGGPSRIENNTFAGQGIEITAPAANSGIHQVLNNRIDAAFPSFFATLIEVKDVQKPGTGVLIEGNQINGFSNSGIFSARSKNVVIRNNIFTPSTGAGDDNFIHIVVNTKQATRSTVQNPAVNEVSIVGNQFKSRPGLGGTGILFANHNDDPSSANAFGNIQIGGAGADANLFGANLRNYVRLDTSSGPSNAVSPWQELPVTTMAPVADNFDVSQNLFTVSGADKRPAVMSLEELFTLEDRMVHGIDAGILGFVKVVNETAFVTDNAFLSPISTTASLQRAANKAEAGWTINIQNTAIDEVVTVNKSLTWNTHPADSMVLGGIAMNGQAGTLLTLGDNFQLSDSLKLDAANGGKISIGNNNLVLLSGAKVAGGNDNTYVQTDGTGNLVIRSISADPVVFPVGTQSSFAPLTFDDQNATGDNFSVRVSPALTSSDFTPSLPSSINSFAQFQWSVCEAIAGGSNATLIFDWRNAANLSGAEPMNSVARNNGADWISSTATIAGQTASVTGASEFCSPFAVVSSTSIQLSTGNPLNKQGIADLLLCPGDTIQVPFTVTGSLSSNNSFILVLSDVNASFATGDTISISPLSGTTSDTIQGIIPAGITPGDNYRVRVQSSNPANIGTSNPDSIRIFGLPAVPLITGLSALCQGDSILLISSEANGNFWSPGGQTNDSIFVNTAGNYSVKVTSSAGCSALSSPFSVSVNPLPEPVITPIALPSICEPDTLNYSTTQAFTSYKWLSTGISPEPSAAIVKIFVPGTYPVRVVVTDVNGCRDTSSVVSGQVNPKPVAEAITGNPANFTACQGDTIVLTANPVSFRYRWLNAGPNDTLRDFKVVSSGSFRVEIATAFGCKDTADAVNTNINALPVPVIQLPVAVVCQFDSLKYSTTQPFTSYQWLNTGITPEPTTAAVKLSAPGAYPVRVLVSDGNGCRDTSDVVNGQVNPKPVSDATTGNPANFTACQGDTIVLTANPVSFRYRWLDAGPNDTLRNFKVISAGSFRVEIANAFGCKDTADAVTTIVNPLPVPVIQLPSATVCQFDSLQYSTSQSFNSYKWLGTGVTPEPVSATVVIKTPGSYPVRVMVTDGNGCSDTSVVAIGQVNPKPVSDATTGNPANFTTCQGDTIVLTANPVSFRYRWLDAGPNDTLRNFKVVSVGSFRVEIANAFGCKDTSDAVTTIVNPLPVPVITTSEPDNRICTGDTIVLTSNFTEGNSWTGLPGNLKTQSIKVANPFDAIRLTVVDVNGCSATTDPVQVIVDPLPSVTIRKDSAYSFADDILLEAVNASLNVSNFEWFRSGISLANTGTTPSFSTSADETSFYSVVITDLNGCKQKDSLLIRVSKEVFIPNSFSPNGDGNNDRFIVYGFGVREILFQVWDRFGNVVYESSDPEQCVERSLSPQSSQKGWDGKFKGDLLPPGSYIWTVKGKFNSGDDLKVEGGKTSGPVLILN